LWLRRLSLRLRKGTANALSAQLLEIVLVLLAPTPRVKIVSGILTSSPLGFAPGTKECRRAITGEIGQIATDHSGKYAG
jgi:hypothetical protein